MRTSRLSRRAVLAGTAAAAALATVPSLPGRAHAATATPTYRWRNVVIGGTGFATGVLFHPSGAKTWLRINDNAHQWGYIGDAITGDPRIHGRVYLATNGRGIQYGELV
jgi:hypothetical protein